MNELILFIIKVCILQVLIYTFYWIALKHTTFHQLNRIYLLSGLLISFILPLIKLSTPILLNTFQLEYLLKDFYEPAHWNNNENTYFTNSTVSTVFNWNKAAFIFYVFFSLLILIRSLWGVVSIISIFKITKPEYLNGISYFTSSEIREPFTFLNWIIVPKDLKDENNKIAILKHEKAHADQWHTLDLLFVEIILTVFWFNPFVFFFRRSLKQVHEYLADSKAIENDEVKADYLNSIVFSAEISNISGVASQFYCLTIKKRIQMITKNKTVKLYKLSYLLIVPLLIVSILTFSNFSFIAPQPINKTENIPAIKPIQEGKYKITSKYGMRKHPITNEMKMHNGVDFAAKKGTPVYATADGMVIKTEFRSGSYGKLIVIQHGSTYSTLYAQLSEFKVQSGDIVKQGDIIGLVGSSGLSTGSHLHYEVWKNGEKVNPEDYFD